MWCLLFQSAWDSLGKLDGALAALELPGDNERTTRQAGEVASVGCAEGADEAARDVVKAHGEGQLREVVGPEVKIVAARVVGKGVV